MEEPTNDRLVETELLETPASQGGDISGMTLNQLEEARAIGRRELTASLLGRAVDLVYLVAVVVWIAQPDSGYMLWLAGLSTVPTVQLVLLTATLITGNLVVSFHSHSTRVTFCSINITCRDRVFFNGFGGKEKVFSWRCFFRLFWSRSSTG